MTRLISIFMIVMLSSATPLSAGPQEDALAVVEEFKRAYDASDPPKIVKLFAPNAVFLGTRMQGPTRDATAILKYFQESAAANLPKKVVIENYEALALSESAVLFSGQNIFFQTRDGKEVQTPARFTLLVTNGPQGWLISHFHSSLRPR